MKKVAIIGAGVSGLCAGIYLQKSGFECEIFEKNHFAGGNLTGWQRGNYHIDNCMHWLTGTNEKKDLYKDWCEVGALGENIEIFQAEYLFCSEYEGQSVHFYKDSQKARDEMKKISPEDSEETDRFFDMVDLNADIIINGGSIIKKIKQFDGILNYGPLSLNALGERFKHPLLRRCFCDYIGGEFSSLGLILAYATFVSGNGGIPKGGSLEMAKRIESKFLSLGGKIRLGCSVEKLFLTENKASCVILENGEEIICDYVVIACDPVVTFSKFLPISSMPSSLAKYYKNKKAFPIFSAFQVAFKVKCEGVPFKTCTIFESRPFFINDYEVSRFVLREYSYEQYAPEGENIFQTMIFQAEDNCRWWLDLYENNKEVYNFQKQEAAKAILERIEERYPNIKNKIEILDIWTPATYKRYFSSNLGSFMSFALTGKGVPMPIQNTPKGYKNIVFASQWQKAPGGLPIALMSAKKACKKIVSMEKAKGMISASL